MKDIGVQLKESDSLEEWMMKHKDSCFPKYSKEKGELSYPERYKAFKTSLHGLQLRVERGAMSAGTVKLMDRVTDVVNEKDDEMRKRLFDELVKSDTVVDLNDHGPEHVAKVIEKVSEMLWFFQSGHLTPYEGFMLLCAIQVHDAGNIFGRENHEKNCIKMMDDLGKNYIPDAFERKVIEKLAMVHGGKIDEDKDTIGRLSLSKVIYERKIRKAMLAALLRFGDELADDTSRADRVGLEQGTILPESRIYHRYSQSLHTVKIAKNNANEKIELNLSYEFDSTIATQEFNKSGQSKYLLDEIYERTLKMERERRYCMRFLRPCFSLDAIRVEITIAHAQNPWKSDKIQYTLEENGYPSAPTTGCMSNVRSGEEEKQFLMKEWGVL